MKIRDPARLLLAVSDLEPEIMLRLSR